MSRIDDLRQEIGNAQRLKMVEQLDEGTARRQWEEAVRRRESTEARIRGMLKELRGLARSAV